MGLIAAWGLGLLGGGAILGLLALAIAVDRFGRCDGAGAADVIVVLGARVREDGSASPALRARLERGVALYRRGLAPWLLFSGGTCRAGTPSEAEVMRRLAEENRVPAGAIVLEEESRDTSQNARYSAALMRRHGFASAVVVSDPFHLLRARQCFRRERLEVAMSPASLSGRGIGRLGRLAGTLREAVAMAKRPRLLFARRVDSPSGRLPSP